MELDLRELSFEEGLGALGITIEDLISNLAQIKNVGPSSKASLADELTLREAVDSYKANYLGKSRTTVKTYSGELERFVGFMEKRWDERAEDNKTISNINRTDIQLFLNIKGYTADTQNKKLAILNSFFKKYLLEEKGIINKSPTRGIPWRNDGHKNIRFLTKEEQEQVLVRALKNKIAGKRDFIIILLGLNTGLRLEEIVSLNIEDINLKKSTLYVRHGKGDKYREVFLRDEVKNVVNAYLKETRVGAFNKTIGSDPLFLNLKGPHSLKRFSYDAAEKMVIRIFRSVGIMEGAMHRLRHSFAVNALEAGLSILEISFLLGHNSITTTIKYLRLSNEQILAKIKDSFPLAYLSIQDVSKYLHSEEGQKIRERFSDLGYEL